MKKDDTCFYCVPVKWIVPLFNLIIFATSSICIAASIIHRNPVPIHLTIIHPLVVWLYLASLGITGLIAIMGIFVSFNESHGWAILYRSIYWFNTVLNICIWQTLNFILAIVNRRSVISACETANSNQNSTSNNTTILLDFKVGATFGFANCDQAIQAGLVGAACSLFLGSIFMIWNGFITNRWTQSLDENRIGWRAKNSKWNEHLDNMSSIYARDKRNAPTYPQKGPVNGFTATLSKLFNK